MRRRLLAAIFFIFMVLTLVTPLSADDTASIGFDGYTEVAEYLNAVASGTGDIAVPELDLNVKSAVLMEASTGTLLYSVEPDAELPPASVTKIMTLLIIMEAIDGDIMTVDDEVTTSEHAASMGGTQLYLEVGETMTVAQLIKAVAVASANDATVALAEHIAGSEAEFVRRMNVRAQELGATHTNFTSCTGLFDDDSHYTTAYDLALMTRELLNHPQIFDYSTIWMDTVRNGSFGLANTNKMLRTYTGMNGMKTGYTKLSKYCFSGTAVRDGMTLIAVVMGSPTSTDRFAATAKMLDFGFATFAVVRATPEPPAPVTVKKGVEQTVPVEIVGGLSLLVGKGQEKLITSEFSIAEMVTAPVSEGTEIGYVTYLLNGEVVKRLPIKTTAAVEKAGFGDYLSRLFKSILG